MNKDDLFFSIVILIAIGFGTMGGLYFKDNVQIDYDNYYEEKYNKRLDKIEICWAFENKNMRFNCYEDKFYWEFMEEYEFEYHFESNESFAIWNEIESQKEVQSHKDGHLGFSFVFGCGIAVLSIFVLLVFFGIIATFMDAFKPGISNYFAQRKKPENVVKDYSSVIVDLKWELSSFRREISDLNYKVNDINKNIQRIMSLQENDY